MNSQLIVSAVGLCLGISSGAAAQVPPPPPAPVEDKMVEDVQQLFSDLTQHQGKIERAQVDEDTIRLQEDILATWDRLLDSAKSPPSSNQSSNENQSSQQNGNSQANPQPQPGQSPSQPNGNAQQQGRPGEQEGVQPGDQEGEQDPDGTPGQSTGQATEDPADQADAEARRRTEGTENRLSQLRQEERERLMKEVWGKLPPRIRQKLLNASDEKYLPEFEDRIREYFRKLSEPQK